MWDFLVYRGLDQIDSYVAQLKQCGLTEEEIDLKVHHDHQDLVKVCVDCLVYRGPGPNRLQHIRAEALWTEGCRLGYKVCVGLLGLPQKLQ